MPVTPQDADRQAFAAGGLDAVWAMYDPAPVMVAGGEGDAVN